MSMLIKYLYKIVLILFIVGCIHGSCANEKLHHSEAIPHVDSVIVQVLGIAQDAGFPQANCAKSCCQNAWSDLKLRQKVSCLAIIDKESQKAWMIDATPDFKDQLYILNRQGLTLAGIFLTHAHIGHYTGLMHLGREAMGSNELPVFSMPRMFDFLSNNGPWNQLVKLKNIQLLKLEDNLAIEMGDKLLITPVLVPHRDEFSETVGFIVQGPNKKLLYIPDIDKWQLWNSEINVLVKELDYLFIDGSFYADGEIPGRNMDQIPHPFIEESMALFRDLDKKNKAKIYFIHLNHTNQVLDINSEAHKIVLESGYNIAYESLQLAL